MFRPFKIILNDASVMNPKDLKKHKDVTYLGLFDGLNFYMDDSYKDLIKKYQISKALIDKDLKTLIKDYVGIEYDDYNIGVVIDDIGFDVVFEIVLYRTETQSMRRYILNCFDALPARDVKSLYKKLKKIQNNMESDELTILRDMYRKLAAQGV